MKNVPAQSRVPWAALGLIFTFAAATRAAYLVAYRSFDPFYFIPLMDAARYDRWGRAIARGEIFEPGAFYQAPLYPYFVGALYASFGARPLVVYVAQMILGLL